jgi:hypothetical protein
MLLSKKTITSYEGAQTMRRVLLLASILVLVCSSLACGGPGKPWVNTLNALYVTGDSALLVGYVDESATAEVFFMIGTSAEMGPTAWKVSAGSVEGPNSFEETVTGLTANTTYFYIAGAKVHGVTGWGPPMQFTTLPPALAAPVMRTDGVTDITSESAILHGTIVSIGGATSLIVDFIVKETSAATPTEVRYGAGTFYSAGAFSVTISVTPGSTYSYMAEGVSVEGYSGHVYGEEKTFNT